MSLSYLTYDDLHRDVMALERRLPRDIVGVVGIPRSGMLPASIIALHRNLPLASSCNLRWLHGGERCPPNTQRCGKLLVVDDSCYRGTAMERARLNLGAATRSDLVFAAVYGHPDTPPGRQPDFVGRIVPGPRYFAWNLFRHADLKDAMLDLDGVLCVDPPVSDSLDADAYAAWLPNAEPLNIPSVKVGAICTNRLRGHRAATEAWLAKHGVQYGELIMSPYDNPEKRERGPIHGWNKGEAYLASRCNLFVESDDGQARVIRESANKPVIALDTGRTYG